MTMRLILICHGATAATRRAAFAVDEPLEDAAIERAKALRKSLLSADRSWTSPALRARQTAEALSLDARAHPVLSHCDYGRWAGQTLKGLEATEPEAIAAWLSDFAAAPHGGEALANLFQRVSAWIDDVLHSDGKTIAVTHASVIRTAVIHLLGAPPASFWRLDTEPLSFVELSGDGQGSRLRLAQTIKGVTSNDGI
ncbi:MAG: histidine phosphatase family protein [Pseudolabrys sp.]